MTTITPTQTWQSRFYREGDVPAIVDLINACAAHDPFDKPTTIEEVASSFAQPLSNPTRDIILIDGPTQPGQPEGTVLALSRALCLDEPATDSRLYQLRIRVHPAVRNTGIEQAISQQAIAHIRALETSGTLDPRSNVSVLAMTREEDAETNAIYRSMGLQPIRYAWEMERSLNDPIPQPKDIEGITFRPYRHPEDNDLARTSYNNSFIDHFEFHAMTPEMWEYGISRPDMRHDLSILAEITTGDRQGQLAGFCICEVMDANNRRLNVQEGWIALLGTTRGWRGVGLGKSLLLRGLQNLKNAGMQTALLGVDSESLTGANRLYESVGFTIRHLEILYKSPLQDLAQS